MPYIKVYLHLNLFYDTRYLSMLPTRLQRYIKMMGTRTQGGAPRARLPWAKKPLGLQPKSDRNGIALSNYGDYDAVGRRAHD